jgi:hypothetical protein
MAKENYMQGLRWYEPKVQRGGVNFFCRAYVAREISAIAGGDYRMYLGRAGKMIKNACSNGYVEPAPDCKRYYRFKAA